MNICDENIFVAFYNSNVKSLRNFLLYKFQDENNADEATQEAFIKIWQNCSEIPIEKAKAYLYKVANNTSLNYISHKKIVLEYEKNHHLNSSTNENPEFVLEENEFKEKLLKAIQNLNETQRIAFLMHRIDGKKYSEIAEELGISIKAVEKRIHIALLELKKEIENFR